jgi:hypothetical protein
MRLIRQDQVLSVVVAAALLTLGCTPSFGWGNDGHEIVALVAESILKKESPDALAQVRALLKKDKDDLTDRDIASRATWADAFRESSPEARNATRQWHFVDIDFQKADMEAACFGNPRVEGLPSQGPADDCVVNKIEEFKAALANSEMPVKERILALKFLLHFVGDVHQPLHAITRVDPDTNQDDHGGNCVGILRGHATVPVRLHSYWDTTLVHRAVGKDVDTAADTVFQRLTPANIKKWDKGSAADWAKESYDVAKSTVYAGVVDQEPEQSDFMFRGRDGKPDQRCGPSNVYRIDSAYDDRAVNVVTEQLAKAGLRLARTLQEALGE